MSTRQPPKTTYRKTKTGEWVVCGPTMSVRPGTSVLVHKADGSTKTEMIERVGEEFDGMVYGYIAKAAKPATKTATKSTSARTSSTRCRECRGELQTWSDGFHDGLCHDCF